MVEAKKIVREIFSIVLSSCIMLGGLLSSSQLYAVTIGSDTAVSRHTAQVTLGNGDRIAGFAAIEGGFKLSSSSVKATFDSFFGVTGDIELQGGNLILGRDLIFRDVTNWKSFGDIAGDFHTLDLAPSMTCIPTIPVLTDTSYTFSNIAVFLSCNVTLKAPTLIFKGNCALIGVGNCLTLDSTTTVAVDINSTLLVKDIIIKGVNDTKIQCLDSSSTITYQDAELVLDGDYTFTKGHFDVVKDLHVVGDGYIFAYQSDQVSTISGCGRMILDQGVTFSYDPPTTNRDLIKLVNSTAELMLNGATLHSTTTGMRLTKGTLVIYGRSYVSSEATVEAEAISFGDGVSAANNLDIQWLPAANFEVLQGHVVYNNV